MYVVSVLFLYGSQIEGLLEDVDFSTKVTREDLESMCADLFDRVGKPVTDALKSADITMVTDLCMLV